MKAVIRSLVVGGVLMIAFAVSASDKTAQSAQATTAAPTPTDDVGRECRRVKELGSRLSKKVCTTRAEREARGRQDRALLYEAQQRGGANVGSSSQ